MPVFALFRESGKKVAGKGPMYRVASFNYGLIVPGEGMIGEIGMRYDAARFERHARTAAAGDPGVAARRGMGQCSFARRRPETATTDDTAAIQKAIEEHRVLYFPSGHYIVTDTLMLKPDTVLIGLHPTLTQFDLPDGTPALSRGGYAARR